MRRTRSRIASITCLPHPPATEARAAALCRPAVAAAHEGDAGAEFVELLADQPGQGVEIGLLVGIILDKVAQPVELAIGVQPPLGEGQQEGLVAGEQVAALAGLGVLHR
jgi:hypothetical protein